MNSNNKVHSELLERFIPKFWGYGTFEAPLWVVGMEEACGDDFKLRIETWQARGERSLDDVKEYHYAIGAKDHFTGKAPLQRTWSKLIKMYLSAYVHPTHTKNTREFQTETLGRSTPSGSTGVPTCLIELMPLPSPNTRKGFEGYSDLDYLQSRKKYLDHVGSKRVRALGDLIQKHVPAVVVFYGSSYDRQWHEISGGFAKHPDHDKMLFHEANGTLFARLPHPVARGITNMDYVTAGKILRKRLIGS